MSVSAPPPSDALGQARRTVKMAIGCWLIVAALNALSQMFWRREMQPGEFGAVNTVLGLVTVLAAPLLGLNLAFTQRHPALEETARLQTVRSALMETAALAWGGLAIVLLFALVPFLDLPRSSLQFLAVLALAATLVAVLGSSLCATTGRTKFWTGLVIAAAAVRLVTSVSLVRAEPWAEAGVAAVMVAGIVTAIPALQARGNPTSRREAWTTLLEGKQVVPFLAFVSVIFAIALFSNADRIVAQHGFGTPNIYQMGYVDWRGFDDYQVAGLIARSLLWITLPVLLVFRAQRGALDRTTTASLRGFWVYLGLLVGGDIVLVVLAPLFSLLFTGDAQGAGHFIPSFAAAIFMLGLLQGIGVFALASRRHPECFLLGACSLGYTVGLYKYGTQPQVMTSCMFGGALISLMAVMFLGVVRYARTHP